VSIIFSQILTTVLVILLGGVHVSMTPVFFDGFEMQAMWYVAQGLLAAVIGIVNLIAARTAWRDRTTALLCHVANGIGLAFIALYSVVDPEVPSYVAIVLFVVLFTSALALDQRRSRA
jgi:hypothetical protein